MRSARLIEMAFNSYINQGSRCVSPPTPFKCIRVLAASRVYRDAVARVVKRSTFVGARLEMLGLK